MGNTIQLVLEVDDRGSAKVAKFSSGLTDQVRKASGGVEQAAGAVGKVRAQCEGLTGIVQRLAAGFAAWKIGDFIKDSTLLSARVETLGVVMERVGANALYSKQEVDGYAAGIKQLGITTEESRQTVVRMIQAHLDLGKASELARVAQDAAVIGNQNSSEALQGLLNGITTLQPEVLRTYGIIVNFEQEYAKFAAAAGRTVESLGAQEKQQIALNAVLGAGAGIAGTYSAAMSTVGKELTSLPRLVAEVEEKVGDLFKPALTVLVHEFSASLKEAGIYLDEAGEPSQRLKELSADLATAVKDGAESVISFAKGVRDLVGVVGPAVPEIAKLLVVGMIADKVITLTRNLGGLRAALLANKELLVFVAAFATADYFERWASGTMKVERETEEARGALQRLQKTLREAQEEERKKSQFEEEANRKFLEDLRGAVEKQNALEAEQERKHNELAKKQAEEDKKYLKSWEDVRETIGRTAYQQQQAALDKEYGAYQRVVEDKTSLERWFTEQKALLAGKESLRIAEEDKQALDTRLQKYQKFYDSVQGLIEKNSETERKHVEKLNALYQQKMDLQRSTAEMVAKLQAPYAPVVSDKERYESQKSGLTDQYLAAMRLEGQEQVAALEQYKQGLAAFAQSWSGGVNESMQTLFGGVQTSITVTGQSVMQSVVSDIEMATQAQQRAIAGMTEEEQKQLTATQAWGKGVAASAREAAAEITKVGGVIAQLEEQIAKMQKVISITGEDHASSVVQQIKNELDALHDKTVTITTYQRTINTDSLDGSAKVTIYDGASGNEISGSSIFPYSQLNLDAGWSPEPKALGTGYIPKTDLYLLHKGEAVTPAAQAGRQLGGVTIAGDLVIQVPAGAAPQRPEDWRLITRQYIIPELQKAGKA